MTIQFHCLPWSWPSITLASMANRVCLPTVHPRACPDCRMLVHSCCITLCTTSRYTRLLASCCSTAIQIKHQEVTASFMQAHPNCLSSLGIGPLSLPAVLIHTLPEWAIYTGRGKNQRAFLLSLSRGYAGPWLHVNLWF